MFRGMQYRAFDCSQFIGPEKAYGSPDEEVRFEEAGYNGNMEYDGSDYEGGDNVEFNEDGGRGQSGDISDFDEGVNYGDMEEDGSDEERVDNDDIEEDGSDAEGVDYGDMEEDGSHDEDQSVQVDSVEDIVALDLSGLGPRIVFGSLDIAFEFYKSYGRANGFSVRKGKLLYCKTGEIVQRTFVCHIQGYREKRGVSEANRKRREKPNTRCGCQAMFRVHINIMTKGWSATVFDNRHNHVLVPQEHCGLLSSHCLMTDSDIMQMNNMLKSGILPNHIYASFANQAGGYDKIGFRRKDLYNQIARQRRLRKTDASCALNYLCGLALNDPMMFFKHTTDSTGRLQHLFWCDGKSRLDYQVYGDIVAFDATYGKNKYHCPLVVFAGVNNHNSTIIFAGAIVADEKEETYVWVLSRFLEAMYGKSPTAVITDGDLAMKKAIKQVFPNAYHRLCAWHLIRNAMSNIGDPAFVGQFRKCMLGDYEIGEFLRKWAETVDSFGLHDNNWIKETYTKRKAWATTHIRGQFFAGFRTTSRCEGLHSEMGKFVHSRHNLEDFLLHYHRCLNFMRYREVQADFESDYGEPVLCTRFPKLELSGAKVFTKEIFCKYQIIINRSSAMIVSGSKETCGYYIYTVNKYMRPDQEWRVSFNPAEDIFKCVCRRMESFGIPCEHIIAVLVFIDHAELPQSLVMSRWTKNAKDVLGSNSNGRPTFWDSHLATRYGALMFRWGRLSKLVVDNGDDYKEQMDIAAAAILKAEQKRGISDSTTNLEEDVVEVNLQNPASVRTKGRCGGVGSTSGTNNRRVTHCSTCGDPGHNKKTCSQRTVGTQDAGNNVDEHVRIFC